MADYYLDGSKIKARREALHNTVEYGLMMLGAWPEMQAGGMAEYERFEATTESDPYGPVTKRQAFQFISLYGFFSFFEYGVVVAGDAITADILGTFQSMSPEDKQKFHTVALFWKIIGPTF